MKHSLKRLLRTSLLTAGLLIVAVSFLRFYFAGKGAWYLVMPGASVRVDQRLTHGWIHRGTDGSDIILTRDDVRRESYLIMLQSSEGAWVVYCGDNWRAPWFPIFMLGDFQTPCVNTDDYRSRRKQRGLVIENNHVAFTANDGCRVTGSW